MTIKYFMAGTVARFPVPVMILFAVIVFIILFVPCCGTSNLPVNDELQMNMLINWSELSKDSHENEYRIIVAGREVTWEWNHRGFPGDGNDIKKYRMSDQELKNLKVYIDSHNLNRNYNEVNEKGKLGLSVHLILAVAMKGTETKIEVAGMYNQWSGTVKSNIKNSELIFGANSLVQCFKDVGTCIMLHHTK